MKTLIIILLFSLSANGQFYYVIPTMNNAENKAKAISKIFYKLSRPAQGSDVTQYLFGWTKHPTNDSVALAIDTASWTPRGGITSTEISAWITEVYPTITTTQKNTLTNYITNNYMLRISKLIITSRIKLWKYSDLEARGWFPKIELK